jgi:hypothetical protein
MRKSQTIRLAILFFFSFNILNAYGQKCKFSKEEFNSEKEILTLETKAFTLVGLSGNDIRTKIGRENDDFYFLLDYSRAVSKKIKTTSIDLNYPKISSINKGNLLIFFLDNDEQVTLHALDDINVTINDSNPLFTDYSFKELKYSISKSDINKLSNNLSYQMRLEHQESTNKSVVKIFRKNFNPLKYHLLQKKAKCITD